MDATAADSETVVGDECHIVARSPEGPRADLALSEEKLNEYENLILLCKNHHKMVDDQPETYTADTLREMKRKHEESIQKRLEGEADIYDVEGYMKLLTAVVRQSDSRNDLYASVGEADFAASWLGRLFEGYQYKTVGPPMIKRLVVKRLHAGAIAELVKQRKLDPEFGERLAGNMKRLETSLAEAGVPIEVRFWFEVPPFHGWLYGNHLLRNQWARGPDGYYHVRTPLRYYTGERHPEVLSLTLAELE